MELKWEYPLPTNINSEDYQYESPILADGKYVYFVSESAGWQKLHIVNKETGTGCSKLLPKSVNILPSKYFFFCIIVRQSFMQEIYTLSRVMA